MINHPLPGQSQLRFACWALRPTFRCRYTPAQGQPAGITALARLAVRQSFAWWPAA